MPKKKDRGVMGLGLLITFVAIVLVVGVAGIVLLTSGGSLQQKSKLKVGEAKKGVSSGLEVISVIGSDCHPTDADGTPHIAENLHIMVRPLPGTIHTNLNTTLIYVEQRDSEYTIKFNSSCASECNAATTVAYNVYYLKRGSYYEPGYVNMGDVAKLSIRTDGVGEDEDIKIHIIPANGPQRIVKILTPMSMVDHRITLWPTS